MLVKGAPGVGIIRQTFYVHNKPITSTNADPDLHRHMALQGHNE